MKNIKGFIFDLDGVITDTAEYHYLAWKRLADEEKVPFTRGDNEALRGVSRRKSLEILLKGAMLDYPEERILDMMARKNAYYMDLLENITPADLLPGVMDVLTGLQDRGIKTAIGSASRNAVAVLTRLGIADLFDGIADGHSVARPKPAPDVFIHAAGQIQVPCANAVVVEDAEAGVQAALEGGMTAVGIGPAERVGKAHFRYDEPGRIDLAEILDGRRSTP